MRFSASRSCTQSQARSSGAAASGLGPAARIRSSAKASASAAPAASWPEAKTSPCSASPLATPGRHPAARTALKASNIGSSAVIESHLEQLCSTYVPICSDSQWVCRQEKSPCRMRPSHPAWPCGTSPLPLPTTRYSLPVGYRVVGRGSGLVPCAGTAESRPGRTPRDSQGRPRSSMPGISGSRSAYSGSCTSMWPSPR